MAGAIAKGGLNSKLNCKKDESAGRELIANGTVLHDHAFRKQRSPGSV